MATKTTTPTTVEEWADVLTKATARLEAATTETTKVKATTARDEAMKGMRAAGASYSQMAEAMGVVPMTARGRYLKIAQ